MVEYYISSIAKYTYADDKFYKNGIPLLDENGDDINEILKLPTLKMGFAP